MEKAARRAARDLFWAIVAAGLIELMRHTLVI